MVTSASAAPSNATFLDGSDTSATLELFRAALGPLETDYYLKVFTRFDAADRAGLSWNWAAGLFTLNWLALRKLWGTALGYAGAVLASAVLVLGIGRLVFDWNSDLQEMILAVLALVSVAVPASLGNALLYTHCRKRMERALEVNATLADACAMLKREAPSRQRLIGLFIGNAVALAALVGAAIAFPDIAMPGSRTQELANVRNTAEGKTQDMAPAAALPASAASAASAVSAASAPSAWASAPVLSASTPASTPATTPAATPAAVASGAFTPAPAPLHASSAAGNALAPRPQAEVPSPVASVPLALSNSPANRLPGTDRSATPAASSQQSASVKSEPPKATPSKAAAPRTKEAPASAAKNAAAKKEPAKAASHDSHVIINVGLFADENNARNAYVKLSDAGLNVLSNEITTKNGKRTRVRVGPFATQAEAERAAERIRALQLEAVIAPQ
jgi:cell division septation protein DedD